MKPFLKLLLAMAIVGTAFSISAQNRKGDYRTTGNLRVGDAAPDFKLKTKEGDREVQLSSFKAKRPVVLVFGSYT